MAIGCVICTEEFATAAVAEKYSIVLKNCGHVFHDICLKMWLKKSKTCPICRTATYDSPLYVSRIHLQRLSMDNPTINNLLDDTADLKRVIKEKKEELESALDEIKNKNEELKRKDKQITELQAALTDIGIQIKNIDESIKSLKKIQIDKAVLPVNLKRDSPQQYEQPTTSTDPRRVASRLTRICSATSSSTSRSVAMSRGARNPVRGRVMSSSALNMPKRNL